MELKKYIQQGEETYLYEYQAALYDAVSYTHLDVYKRQL